jgi:hypothetical protein
MNTIKVDIANYRHYWRGTPGVGKSSTFRDLIIEAYGEAKYGLLISLGYEVGYKALDNLMVKDCPQWGDFKDVVDDLVENKDKNEFKILALDTVDELVEMAERKVMAIHLAQKGEPATSLNSCLGGYGAGKKKARQLIEEQIGRLEQAGYGMVYIGHTKNKDIKTQLAEETYQMVTGSLEFAYDAIFADRADLMPMFVQEFSIKDDRKKDSTRFIYFRGTDFIDAKSRISGEFLPEKIELSAKNYYDIIKEALEKSTGKTGKELKEMKKEEAKVVEKISNDFVSSEKSKKASLFEDIEQLVPAIMELVGEMDRETATSKKKQLEAQDLPNSPSKFKTITDLEIGKKVYNILKSK